MLKIDMRVDFFRQIPRSQLAVVNTLLHVTNIYDCVRAFCFCGNGFDSNSSSAQAPSCLNEQNCSQIIGVPLNFYWVNYGQFQTLVDVSEINIGFPISKRQKIF